MTKATDKPSMDVQEYNWEVLDEGKPRLVTAWQKTLGLEQEIRIAQAIRRLELEDVKDLMSLSITQILNLLAEREIVQDMFMAVLILNKGCKKEDVLHIPYPVQKAVLRDFFTFNKELISDLQNFVSIRITTPKPPGKGRPSPRKKPSTSASKAG